MPQRQNKKIKVEYYVYFSYSKKENQYYIGFSGKKKSQYDNYYGTSRKVNIWPDKQKVTLGIFDRKSHAKFAELLLQIDSMYDPRCINAMYHIRLNKKCLTGFNMTKTKQAFENILKSYWL